MQLDVRIDHGRIISGDGTTGTDPVMRSIGIADDRIVMGVNPATDARRVIDATGLVVCPGFIDIHSHSDFAALHASSGASKVLAGYTTELNGNCGFGAFPLYGMQKLQLMEEHAPHGLKIDWETVDGYFRKCEKNPMTLNQGLLLGHGTLHGSIVGTDPRPRKADRAERQRMVREAERAMRIGCFGLSTGLVYAPGSFAEHDEILELAHVVAHHGGLYASHLRSESDQLLEALDEFLGVCEAAGCRAQYSHIKTAGPRNWHKLSDVRKRMVEARARGVEIHGDRYPYTASCTALAVILLPNDALGPRQHIVEQLTDRKKRDELAGRIRQREQIDAGDGARRGHLSGPAWYERVMIGAVENEALRDAQGMTLAKWAERVGAADPLEAAFDLLIDDHAATSGIHFSMSEDNMRTIMNWPDVCIGSDAHIHEHCDGHCAGLHPREFGTPGRVLGQLCRDAKWFDLPTAVHKLTGLPAKIMRLRDRGLVRDGYHADLVLFDPRKIADRATYVNPAQSPAGIHYVFINGRMVVKPDANAPGSGEAELMHVTPPPGRLLKFEG